MTLSPEFEIVEVLGEGSFGTVCVARVSEGPLRRMVALKILKGAYTTNRKILHRTRDEARLLARLDHPQIVRVEQLMEMDGRPVVVMELVRGVSLDQLLTRFRAGLPVSIAFDVTRQTLAALHVAHNEAKDESDRPMRVIHRDIKPSNVLISIHGEVKVVDFGIAKGDFEDRESETESVVLGSRPYMAPERLDGVSDSPAVDVYSAGMSLFELLTGHTMNLSINPTAHERAMDRQLALMTIPGLDAHGHDALRALLRDMCAYDRDGRPAARDAERRLEAISEHVASEHRMTLPDFAHRVVQPMYESRTRRSPDDDIADDTGRLRLDRSVTDADIRAEMTVIEPALTLQRVVTAAPIVFLTALVGAILGGVVLQFFLPGTVDPTPPGLARVRIWIPGDAEAQVGDIALGGPGILDIREGSRDLTLRFDDGRTLRCPFEAHDGVAVRYVVDAGQDAISVNDGVATPCTTTGVRGSD